MKGVIKKLDEKGYGFITIEGKKDLFFHANDCTEGNFKEMKQGDTVSFETEDSDKGPKAVNVVLATGMDEAVAEETADEQEAA